MFDRKTAVWFFYRGRVCLENDLMLISSTADCPFSGRVIGIHGAVVLAEERALVK